MSSKIAAINPFEYNNWNDLIASFAGYSIFHTVQFARVINETYGYRPCYYGSVRNNELSALAPLMDIQSRITGRRGVSLPFADYCDICPGRSQELQPIINQIITFGKKCGWKYIEFRPSGSFLPHAEPSTSFYRHTLHLNKDPGITLSSMRSSTKRNIKKALSSDVSVLFSTDADAVYHYYRLHCITRKTQGIPPQPFLFFKNIHRYLIEQNLGFTALASCKGRHIAGAVFLYVGRKAYYKFGAMDKRFQHLRGFNLVIWKAIEHFAERGFESLCFGRTDPANAGLLQFKNGWNTTQEALHYFKYDLRNNRFARDKNFSHTALTSIFRCTPVPVLKVIGRLLYPHIG